MTDLYEAIDLALDLTVDLPAGPERGQVEYKLHEAKLWLSVVPGFTPSVMGTAAPVGTVKTAPAPSTSTTTAVDVPSNEVPVPVESPPPPATKDNPTPVVTAVPITPGFTHPDEVLPPLDDPEFSSKDVDTDDPEVRVNDDSAFPFVNLHPMSPRLLKRYRKETITEDGRTLTVHIYEDGTRIIVSPH